MSEEKLDKIIQALDKEENALMMIVLQLIELNALMKKLNYISGTTREIKDEEMRAELEFLQEYVNCIMNKGAICPIRGLSRKLGRHIGEGEEIKNESKEE